jgi:hypothetical protein
VRVAAVIASIAAVVGLAAWLGVKGEGEHRFSQAELARILNPAPSAPAGTEYGGAQARTFQHDEFAGQPGLDAVVQGYGTQFTTADRRVNGAALGLRFPDEAAAEQALAPVRQSLASGTARPAYGTPTGLGPGAWTLSLKDTQSGRLEAFGWRRGNLVLVTVLAGDGTRLDQADAATYAHAVDARAAAL